MKRFTEYPEKEEQQYTEQVVQAATLLRLLYLGDERPDFPTTLAAVAPQTVFSP
ncbi:hypothetical protein IQ241_01830 [Romeria aff. gracilis LEGE 07310]|uniref:Uncharacterized protein n=1 Tax=Vasconcelosia minhoensis LEGE 07310 TaxID=915328 RepID=A0A8J7DB89_9CYAN|nr:hypothetical protein [Romeria gracilis]MBE9076043.1 hypothetical protein [Romeria aff. gracilis LEGE 07310]